MLFAIPIREVSEWLKELAWKASIWVTVSRVRIPSSLLIHSQIQLKPFKSYDLKDFLVNTFSNHSNFYILKEYYSGYLILYIQSAPITRKTL